MNEQCWMCVPTDPPRLVRKEESAPLCNRHFSWWVARYLNSDDEAPCGAHVITESRTEETRRVHV